MKNIYSFIVLFICCACFSVNAQNVQLIIKNIDGSSEIKDVVLAKQSDGAMRLVIPAKDITKGVKYIDIQHPNFIANVGDNGYWLGNRGQLGYFKYNKGIWTTNIYNNYHLIPIQAFKTDKGMFLAWIKGLRFEAESRVVSRENRYYMTFRIRVEEMGFDAYEDAVIDYYNLGKNAQYSEVGRFFRNKRLSMGEIIPLTEKMKKLPNVKYQADTFVTRLHVFASKPRVPGDQTPETEPDVKVFMTTKQAEDIMQAFKNAGIDKMEFCCAGWTTGGYDGRFPSLFPVEELIGGEAGFKKMIEKAKSLGYTIACHTANTGAYKISPMWSEDYICKKPNGSLLRGETYWAGGNTYRVCLERAWQLFVPKELKQVKDLGVNGSHYIDVFTAISPYPCFDKNHATNRKQSAEAQRKIAQFCIDNLHGFSSECGEDHLINELTYINYVSADIKRWQGYNFIDKKLKNFDTILPLKRPKNSKTLIDNIVPLWEIVYHGFVYHNADRITQRHTTAWNKRISKKLPLVLVEFGARPIFYTNSLKNVNQIAKAYREYKPLAYLSTVFMDFHKIINENVRLIGYADGSRIVINYGNQPFYFEGVDIPPISYKLLRASAK
ncbi:MAG: hypothetical protein E7035_04430 [Verrucomicrobiaceae bacterium]|nr:hypothetical protein [Verrucomicrobiaceae bacterium]